MEVNLGMMKMLLGFGDLALIFKATVELNMSNLNFPEFSSNTYLVFP